MTQTLPEFGLRAYAVLFAKYGPRETFKQSALDWIVSQSMKKKIFALLLKAGWIRKASRASYFCEKPEETIKGLAELKVFDVMKKAAKPYAFTGLSAVEIWSDYSYVQRGIEKSPYFIKVMKKDLKYWKGFLRKEHVPWYVHEGSTIGEYVILMPVEHITSVEKECLKVEPLQRALQIAKKNEMYRYAYNYMRGKYGTSAA